MRIAVNVRWLSWGPLNYSDLASRGSTVNRLRAGLGIAQSICLSSRRAERLAGREPKHLKHLVLIWGSASVTRSVSQ